MKEQNSIDALLENFDPNKEDKKVGGRQAITVWVTPDRKEKYDAVQMKSNRRFSSVIREVVELSIDKKFEAEA